MHQRLLVCAGRKNAALPLADGHRVRPKELAELCLGQAQVAAQRCDGRRLHKSKNNPIDKPWLSCVTLYVNPVEFPIELLARHDISNMPIFTRRRLQAMLDELESSLTEAKCTDLLRRLENKRVEQALPAEMELALLWGLLQLGDIEVEPEWFGTGRMPDAYSEMLFPAHPAVVEITAVSDASLSQEDEMRRTASHLCEAANRVRRSLGHHLHFQFGEESGHTMQGYVRRRKVDPEFTVSSDIAQQLAAWLKTTGDAAHAPLRITRGKTDLVVTWHKLKQSRHSNFFSSMPAEAYSLIDNPLRSALKAKAEQLKSEDFSGVRCLLLADAGSKLLRHLNAGMRSPGAVSGRQIVESFLAQDGCGLDVVCVFSPHRDTNFMSFPRKPLTWSASAFVRPGVDVAMDGLTKLASVLPRPRFEGYQARSLQQQAAYAADARGWYVGTHIASGRIKMIISISARAFLDLLAGRLTPEQFNHMIGMDGSRSRANLFKLCLERGEIISSIKIEPGGLDEDDDRLVVEFSKDPSASRLSRNGRGPGGSSGAESNGAATSQ